MNTATISTSVSALSGIVSLALLVFALRAYGRSREAPMAFVAGAFTVFALKSFYVAFAVHTGTTAHETLELLDAVGDFATVFLLVLPMFFSRKDA